MNENGINQIPVVRQAEGHISIKSITDTFSKILDEVEDRNPICESKLIDRSRLLEQGS